MSGASNAKRSATGFKQWQQTLIWLGVLVVSAGVSYAVGRVQTAKRIEVAEAKATSLQELAQARSKDVTAEQVVVQRLEARRQLHLMLLAIDNRNFGIARQHQQVVARLLEASQPAADSDLAKLTRDIAAFRLVATEDLGAPRATVLSWVRQFDQALPPREK
jgi:hypothetical protein